MKRTRGSTTATPHQVIKPTASDGAIGNTGGTAPGVGGAGGVVETNPYLLVR